MMDEDAIRALIANHLGTDTARAGDGAFFQADLGADSLDIIELTILLENDLGIAIADEESERCATVGDALQLVRHKLEARAERALAVG